MITEEEIEKLLDCSKRKLKECIACDMTYTDRKNIKEYIEKLENELNQLTSYILINGVDERLKTATQIKVENFHKYLHQEHVERLKYRIEQLETEKQKLIEKIKLDIEELDMIHDNYIDANVLEGTYETLGRICYAQNILSYMKGEEK